jgi:hypothetical protein
MTLEVVMSVFVVLLAVVCLVAYRVLPWDRWLEAIYQARRFRQITRAVGFGVLSVNEARQLNSLPPIPDGDFHYIITPEGAVQVRDLEDTYFKPRAD